MEIDEIAEKQKNKLIKEQKKLIEKYKKKNQALKNRWKKLKHIITKDMYRNTNSYNNSYMVTFLNYNAIEDWILKRIEELEKTE